MQTERRGTCVDSVESIAWTRLFLRLTACYVCDEAPERFRITEHVKRCVGCVLSDRFHEKGTALLAIPQQPEPEIGTLS